MCSIGEDDFGDEGGAHTMQADPKLPASAIVSNEICKKCNERTVAVKLNLKDAQCEPCFFQYVRHKFRATMGQSKMIQRGAKVLLAFDGTLEACVMLDMIRYAVSQEQFKRLSLESYAVYIDDACISGQSIDQRKEKLNEAFKILKHFGVETYYASIAKNLPITKAESFEINQEQLTIEEKFIKKLNAIGNQTAKEDFINVLKLNIYRELAAKIDCKYVFVPSISHQVATNLLVNVALGRGKSVANDISFCDNRSHFPPIIRPMRNISQLEIETYIRLDKTLNRLTQNSNSFNAPIKNSITSIQSLTKQFIDNLQENFASTVSTVFRTGDKISAAAATTTTMTTKSQSDGDKARETCKFCHSDLDYENSSTLFAIEYSRCVSACADQKEVNDVDLMLKKAENQVLGKNDDDTENLIKSLCHGCRNIFRDLNEPSTYVQ